jgi:hypothetical protein
MAQTLEQSRVLATPTLMINGRVVKIIPGSLSESGGGEVKVRTVSAGGGAFEIVRGVDAKQFMTALKFEVANTAENQDFVEQLHADAALGLSATVLLVNDGKQKAFDDMCMTNKFDAKYEAEGNIPVEMSGKWNA